jgi:transcriptional regulator with XRE-family HTH domain
MTINTESFRRLRADRGLSVRALARAAGVSTETVYSVEHGKRQPSVRTLGKLAAALGVSIQELFT